LGVFGRKTQDPSTWFYLKRGNLGLNKWGPNFRSSKKVQYLLQKGVEYTLYAK